MNAPVEATEPLASQLERDGYGLRQVLPPEVVAEVLAGFEALDPRSKPIVYRTFVDDSREEARAVDQALKAAIGPHVAAVLPDHDILVATYINKGPYGPVIDYHQDWTFTDERTHRSVLLWIPLVDVEASTGGLGVIPGSHRWTDGLRTASDVREGPTVPHQDAMAAAVTVHPLQAGEGVIYDPAIIHGSGPNQSDLDRPALIVITGPRGAPVVHFVEHLDRIDGYLVDEAYFTTSPFESTPQGPAYEAWERAVVPEDFVEPLRKLGFESPPTPAAEPEPEPEPEPPAPATPPARAASTVRSRLGALVRALRRRS